MKRPILSIITVNLNNEKGLINTLDSLKKQSFKSYEHIIIDGGSSDNSKEIITEYEKNSPHLAYWVSEPDKGIYDGMNKGIDQAKGEYIYFLNSGDYLSDKDALSSIAFDGTKFICGNMSIEYLDATHESIIPPNTVDAIFLLKSFLPHPASFIHKSLFKDNKYRTDYRIISDWIHMVESLIFKRCSYKHVNTFISIFDANGLSSQNGDIGQTERDKWIKEHVSISIYNTLMEFDMYKESELGSIIPIVLRKKHKTQKRIKRLVLLLTRFLK